KKSHATYHLVHHLRVYFGFDCKIDNAHAFELHNDNPVGHCRINYWRSHCPAVFKAERRSSLSPCRIDPLHYRSNYRPFYRGQIHLITRYKSRFCFSSLSASETRLSPEASFLPGASESRPQHDGIPEGRVRHPSLPIPEAIPIQVPYSV